jgi:tRNA threonylcarbamoyladenosine dehydratase
MMCVMLTPANATPVRSDDAPFDPSDPARLVELLDTPALDATDDRRFAGVSRLYGAAGLARLRGAHVAVVGLGGVGSWVVEACARSGVGTLTLIDLDHVAESNINRQLHALESTLGAAKAEVMAQRVVDIDPRCIVHPVEDFVEPDNLAALVPAGRFDFVVDAIDHVRAKTALVVHCHALGIPLVTIGGAGGRTDASRVRVTDLAHTLQEPMLAKVRKNLRTHHGFPRNLKKTFGIPAVFSDQPLRGNEAAIAVRRDGMTGLNCSGFGSMVSVTAVFGFVAAGLVIDRLARGQ